MTQKQKQGVKQAAREFYLAERITLEMALWAMKNASYTKKETAEWLNLAEWPIEQEKATGGING
jgi:hypothetical protein